MDEIGKMSHAQRIATIATIISLDDPKFNIDTWLKREQFFVGYAAEEKAYRNRKMGYKTPKTTNAAAKAASVGIPLTHIKQMLEKDEKKPLKEEPKPQHILLRGSPVKLPKQ